MADKADSVARFLGFAFANADLLFEIDSDGRIVFALGARRNVTGATQNAVTGSHWRDLVADRDHAFMQALLSQLNRPGRFGPVRLALKSGDTGLTRFASLSGCRLDAEDSRIQCVISLSSAGALGDEDSDPGHMLSHDDFVKSAPDTVRRAFDAGIELILEVVDVQSIRPTLTSPDQAEAMIATLSNLLRAEAYGGGGVARLAGDQYALLRRAEGGAGFGERMGRFASQYGAQGPITASIPLDGRQPAVPMLRALKATLDAVLSHGLADPRLCDPARLFADTMETILADAERFHIRVEQSDFKLVYQPVVELDQETVRHYEALARLGGEASPADAIKLAEDLDLIDVFDLAVLGRVIDRLKADESQSLRLAFNVSAISLARDGFQEEALSRITKAGGSVSRRLMIEITETARMDNLGEINTRLQTLRALGVRICLDDFGVGEANLRYLRELDIDLVKFDGVFCAKILHAPREQVMVRHLAALCRELHIKTVAEMVEDAPTAAMIKSLGVDLAQGWHFGEPVEMIAPITQIARRKGEKVAWG